MFTHSYVKVADNKLMDLQFFLITRPGLFILILAISEKPSISLEEAVKFNYKSCNTPKIKCNIIDKPILFKKKYEYLIAIPYNSFKTPTNICG